MSSATESTVITTQPAPNMNEGFSQFHPLVNQVPEQENEAKEQQRQVHNMWCCSMSCEECCECAECCLECCQDAEDIAGLNNDEGGSCFDCCADGADCCTE